MISEKKKSIIFLARLIVSVVILAVVLFSFANLQEVWSSISSFSFFTLVVLVLMYCFGQVLSSIKWNMFLKAVNVDRPSLLVLRSYFSGMLVNSIGLGTVGGDLWRAMGVFPKPEERTRVISSVVGDRLHGLIVLISIGFICTLILKRGQPPWQIVLLASGGVLAIILGMKFFAEYFS